MKFVVLLLALVATALAANTHKARCDFAATNTANEASLSGYAILEKAGDSDAITATTSVRIVVNGLTTNPAAEHGIHVHEIGDLFKNNEAGTGTGGHFVGGGSATHGRPDPNGLTAGTPSTNYAQRHAGDLGSWQFTAGALDVTKQLDGLQFTGANSIIGRAIVIHELPDDGSQPTGGAGSRLAYCVIGVAKPGDNDTNLATAPTGWTAGVAVFRGTTGCTNTTACKFFDAGKVFFWKQGTTAHVYGDVPVGAGNAANKNGLHIHTYGEAHGDGTAAGGHYALDTAHAHAYPPSTTRHFGDLGNMQVVTNGRQMYHYEYPDTDPLFVNFDKIFGRGLVMHSGTDCGGDATGQAGSRQLVAVIGYALPGDVSPQVASATPAYPANAFGTPNCTPPEGDSSSTMAASLALLITLLISVMVL